MAKLLTRPTARERFQAVCIPPHLIVEQGLLKSWTVKLASLRWEAVVTFCKEVTLMMMMNVFSASSLKDWACVSLVGPMPHNWVT